MKRFTQLFFFLFALSLLTGSCSGQSSSDTTVTAADKDSAAMADFYAKNTDDGSKSISSGTVGNGSLSNGKIMPCSGSNFRYFSSESYLAGRAFVTDKVRDITISAFGKLEKNSPGRMFRIMECSNKEGGKISPHHTHQNGTSIDFMIPLKKDGDAYYGLDSTGPSHYLLSFDDNGKYSKDESIEIDFEMLAREIIALDDAAKEQGMKIEKVILKKELTDELRATNSGKEITKRNIYITRNLTPLINSLHDDHFHVDFGK